MITLKHLAREFNDADPYKLRQRLRAQFGKRRRWRWDPDIPQDKADLEEVRSFLKSPVDIKPQKP